MHVVGYSAGGAVATLLAVHYPALVSSVASVEGVFTLGDAFWAFKFAKMGLEKVETELAGCRANPAAWLARAGVPATSWTLAVAEASFAHQPAKTLQVQSQAIIDATGPTSFLQGVRQILDAGVPFHLISGSRSSSTWGVPDWVRRRAASDIEVPNVGHLMMLEDRNAFASAVLSPLGRVQ